jgi:hypothetical protein
MYVERNNETYEEATGYKKNMSIAFLYVIAKVYLYHIDLKICRHIMLHEFQL